MILERRIPFQYWFGLIKWDLIMVTIFSFVIFIVTRYFTDFELPIALGTFMGTAIALLLSIKLGQSYDRWWEARKIWGAIVNDSRSLVMQVKSFSPVQESEQVKTVALRQIAWCYSLGQNLRKLDPIENLAPYLSFEEYEYLKDQKNVPMSLMNNQTQDIAELHANRALNDYQQMQLDDTIVRLVASMGKAERIKNTEFPKTYRVTLHVFIFIFLIALSFSLSELYNLGAFEIPLLISIAIPFFLLEKIAYTIQDPFENRPTDTSMTSIARTIEINLLQIIETEKKQLPNQLTAKDFYIM